MATLADDDAHGRIFLVGVVLGSLCGFLAGSVISSELNWQTGRTLRRAVSFILREPDGPEFELLYQ
ncbi:MAG: hypothetical protein HY329_01505 [Chloroflexi bacterium]|nr:hypothetical protein [Chloroflexota bacterium]